MTLWNGSVWVEDSPAPTSPPRRGRRFVGAAAEAGIIVTLIFGLIAGTALAAPGNGNGGGGGGKGAKEAGSIALVVLDGASAPQHRGRITFEVSTTASDRPFVGLRCWQASTWMYDAYVGYFADYMYDRDWFVLDSPYWQAGTDATCTARLFYYDKRGNQKVLANTDFAVAP